MADYDANYSFERQIEPKKRTGANSFANMPDGAIMRPFAKSKNYRSGICNDVTYGIEEISGIHENKK